jgi:hypothetical protein
VFENVPTFVKCEAAEKRVSEVEFSSRCCSSRNDKAKEMTQNWDRRAGEKIKVPS